MKLIVTISFLLISASTFSQKNNLAKIDSSCIYIKFISKHYAPILATVYTSSSANVFSQNCFIPNDAWMRYNSDSTRPCFVNVDYTFPDKKPLLVKGQYFKGDSLIVDMDSRLTTVIRRKK